MSLLIPEMSVGEVITTLAEIYVHMINNNLPYSDFPSPFLWGPPGVGKSEGIKELAELLQNKTGKKVIVTDIRLLLFSPIDLRGVPVADETRCFTDWLMPRILDLDEAKDTVNILFLDELSAAPQSVQAAAYQLTLNRAIGEHKLPDNTIVVAAGNRTGDKAVAYKMPSALANRMMHFDICVDFKGWTEWAVEKGNIHPFVLGYLMFDTSKLLSTDIGYGELAFPTPRSWTFVSNILNAFGEMDDIGKYHSLLAGCVGVGTAVEFIAWSKAYKDLPSTEDVFLGKAVKAPNTPDALCALIGSMTTYAVRKEQGSDTDGLTIEELDNACGFCFGLPTEYATRFILNIFAIDGIRMKLMKSATFMSWTKQHGRVFKEAGVVIA